MTKIKPRAIFAITAGKYNGKYAVCIDKDSTSYKFLFLPVMEAQTIPAKAVVEGVKEKILDWIEILPEDVFIICKEQYIKSAKSSKTSNPRLLEPAI
jgi:hypothetical protein